MPIQSIFRSVISIHSREHGVSMSVPNSMKDNEIFGFCAANIANPDVTYNRSTETQEIMFAISFIIICMKNVSILIGEEE